MEGLTKWMSEGIMAVVLLFWVFTWLERQRLRKRPERIIKLNDDEAVGSHAYPNRTISLK